MTRVSLICALSVLAVGLTGCPHTPATMEMDPTQAYVDARSALLQAVGDTDPRVRAHAMEALAAIEGIGAGPALMQGLRDDRQPVIAAAALGVGQSRYGPAKPRLLQMAANPDMPPKLLCAVIYGLHRLGNDQYTGELGQLLRHNDKWVRAEAARIMGMMGEASAIGPLKSLQADDREVIVRLQLAVALALLGDERSVRLAGGFTKSQFMEDKLLAVEALGKINRPEAKGILKGLYRADGQDAIIYVAAAGALAQLKDNRGYGTALAAAEAPLEELKRVRGRDAKIKPQEVVILQMYAARALMHMGDTAAVDVLHPLLSDARNGSVRVVSAQAILTLLKSHGSAAEPTEPVKAPDKTPRVVRPPLHSSSGKD